MSERETGVSLNGALQLAVAHYWRTFGVKQRLAQYLAQRDDE